MAVNDTELAEAFNQVADAWQEKWVYWPGSHSDHQKMHHGHACSEPYHTHNDPTIIGGV